MRRAATVITLTAVALGVAGCAGWRSEKQGRDVGRAVCDVKNADNADQAQRALNKLNRRMDDAQRIIGRKVGEDVQDIQNNLNDLVNHASDGQKTLAKQDVAAIQRNVQTVANQAPGLTGRFYQGVNEGLGDCT